MVGAGFSLEYCAMSNKTSTFFWWADGAGKTTIGRLLAKRLHLHSSIPITTKTYRRLFR
jgi:replication-associated recombination protein RarA